MSDDNIEETPEETPDEVSDDAKLEGEEPADEPSDEPEDGDDDGDGGDDGDGDGDGDDGDGDGGDGPADPEPADPEPADPEPSEELGKTFYFDGRDLSAKELHEAAMNLKSDYTVKAQKLSAFENPKEKADKTEVLKKYKKEDLEAFKEVASVLGFVSQEELTKRDAKSSQDTAVKEFTQKHPEYGAEQDPNGVNWQKLQHQLGRYNTDSTNLSWALEKAYSDLNRDKSSMSVTKDLAQRTKLRRSSVSSASSKKTSKPSHDYTAEQVAAMKKMGVWEND